MKNKLAIQQAIQTLIEEGRKAYREDANVTPDECIGMALASQIDDSSTFLEIAATAFEDWNGHCEADVLRSMKRGVMRYARGETATIDLTK